MPNAPRVSTTVAAALQVLRMLAEKSADVRITEVARELDCGKSTAHLLLTTLVEQGFVEKTVESRYRLGFTAFEVGSAVPAAARFGGALVGPMQALADESGEAVSLAVVRARDAVIVQRFETKHILRAEIGVGTRMPLLSCASGKVLLAHMAEEQVDSIYPGDVLPRVTARSMRSKKRLKATFPTIREQGYALNDEEYVDGIAGIAAGVTDAGGAYLAALSVAGPASRFLPARWVEPLIDAADGMSALLAKN